MRAPHVLPASLFGAACLLGSFSDFAGAAHSSLSTLNLPDVEPVDVDATPAAPLEEEPIPLSNPAAAAADAAADLEQPAAAAGLDEEALSKVFELGQKYPANQRYGIMTAAAGLAGFVFFMLLHFLVQAAKGAPLGEERFFNKENGKVTFSGAGALMSLAILSAGVIEMFEQKRNNGLKGDLFLFPSRGKGSLSLGVETLKISGVMLLVGWLFGVPTFLLQLGTTAFLFGFALAGLGATHMLLDAMEAIKLSKQLFEMGGGDVGSLKESVGPLEPHLLKNLMEHFVKESGEKGEPLLTPERLDAMTAAVASILSKAHTPEGQAQLESLMSEVKNVIGIAPALFSNDTLAAVAEQLQQLQLDQQREEAAEEDAAAGEAEADPQEEAQPEVQSQQAAQMKELLSEDDEEETADEETADEETPAAAEEEEEEEEAAAAAAAAAAEAETEEREEEEAEDEEEAGLLGGFE